MKAHCNDASAITHQRSSGTSKLRQRVSADLQSGEKGFAICLQIFAFQRLSGSECDAVNQKIKPAEFRGQALEGLVNFVPSAPLARQPAPIRPLCFPPTF